MLDMEQSQRRDIDLTLTDRITLGVDEENVTHSPYVLPYDNFKGNNWFLQGTKFVKLNLIEKDKISFVTPPLTNLQYKDITNVIVGFDYEISNVTGNYPILDNISFESVGLTSYKSSETILTTQGHIDVSCSLFDFDKDLVNSAISEQGFTIGLNFKGNKSNATVKLSNVKASFEFENKLEDEIIAVSNRISTSFDAYVEDECLVIDFFGSGQGSSSSGGIDIDTINRLINTALNNLGIDLSIDLLSNGYAKFEVNLNKENL